MKTTTKILAMTALLTTAVPLNAQERWGFEFRANTSVSTNEVASESLGAGLAFEGGVHLRLVHHLGLYAGWDWAHFNPDQSFAGPDMDIEETGYAFGLRWVHPLGGEAGDGPAVWLRGGGTWNHLEVEDAEGDLVADSGHGLGWEAGLGLSVPLAGRWRLTPGVRYRELERPVEVGTVSTDVRLRYVAFEIGFSRAF